MVLSYGTQDVVDGQQTLDEVAHVLNVASETDGLGLPADTPVWAVVIQSTLQRLVTAVDNLLQSQQELKTALQHRGGDSAGAQERTAGAQDRRTAPRGVP